MSFGYLFSSIDNTSIMTYKHEFTIGHFQWKYASLDSVALRKHTKLMYIKYLFHNFKTFERMLFYFVVVWISRALCLLFTNPSYCFETGLVVK